MRIAILGRTRMLIRSADALLAKGHSIVFVATTQPAPEYGVGPDDFAALASRCGAEFLLEPQINEPAFTAKLLSSAAQVGVSVNWPTILQHEVCYATQYGILNAHAGDLPRYRGNACPNWAIINGEDRVGLCVHRMEPGSIDSGPVYARASMSLTEDTYIEDVYSWMETNVPLLFVDAVSRLSNSEFVPEDQRISEVKPLRCHPRRPADGRIDWASDASDILRLVRASSRPFAGAFSWLEGGERVTIWRARSASLKHDVLAVPGQIMGRGVHGGVLVACGQGTIEIEEAHVESKRTLPLSNRFRLTSWPRSAEGVS